MNIKCSTHVLEFDDWCWWRRISFQCSRTKWFRVWYCLSNFGRWVMWQLLLAKEVLVSSALQFDIELKKLKSKISADRYFKSTKLNSGNQKPYRYNCQRCFFFSLFLTVVWHWTFSSQSKYTQRKHKSWSVNDQGVNNRFDLIYLFIFYFGFLI